MKKVLFFIHNGWVFGKIHNELIKLLYPEFYCDIRCWSESWHQDEAKLFNDKYDLFVSTPEAVFILNKRYGIPMHKLVGIVHADWDIFNAIEKHKMTSNDFSALGGYAVIWPMGQNISFTYGIKRVPEVLRIGLFNDLYSKPTASEVQSFGYFGKSVRCDRGDTDIKRGHLADTVSQLTNVPLKKCDSLHFLVADRLYRNVDFVMFCSLSEGNPYPALEAFASGIPVIGTNTGVFPEYVKNGAGVILPFEEKAFIEGAVKTITMWKENPEIYQAACHSALNESKKFEWSVLKSKWVDYLNNLLNK